MNATQRERLLQRYMSAVQDYLSGADDSALEKAYDLGREAVAAGFGLLEMTTIHKRALVTAMCGAPPSGEGARIAERAMDFFGETMGAFEMVYRGYREANEALHRSEKQLRLVTDSLPVLIGYFDRELRFRFANKTCEAWYALPKDKLIGRRLSDIVGDTAFELLRPHVERTLAGSPAAFQEAITYPDGKTRSIEAIFVPHAEREGTVEGFFALTRDETERKATEAQLRQAQKMEVVGQLTGGLAHDFNNLLLVVIGNLELIQERLKHDPHALEPVKNALQAGWRGAELTRKLLAFSRKQTLQTATIQLNELVSGMTQLLRRTLGERIEIELVAAKDLWQAETDPALVESAIMNLAVNARDAMPDGGRLIIETANAHLDSDYAARNAEVVPGDYVVIAVTDTGAGIAPENLSRVFEPFFTTKGVGKGSGLGLSMIYGFAKQSGGHLKIYSEVGHGTTVRLYLPRATASARSAAPAGGVSTGDALAANGELVLVVEDNPDVRHVTVAQLTDLGYRTVEAPNAMVALDLITRRPEIDLLFTDIVMPGDMTGYDLGKAAQAIRPGLRILYTSGFTEVSLQGSRQGGGPRHRLSKPYRKRDLALKLREVLRNGDP